MTTRSWQLVGLLLGIVFLAGSAQAAQQTFHFRFEDTVSGAQAVGTITMDPALVSSNVVFPSPAVTALSVTVTGSTGGDGTFTLADFASMIFDTGGGTLDFSRELVGQPTSLGRVWGPGSNGSGDFNLFGATCGGAPATAPAGVPAAQAPVGVDPFLLAAENGTCTAQEQMELTSFAPAAAASTAVPALGPRGMLALFGLLLLAAALVRRRVAG